MNVFINAKRLGVLLLLLTLVLCGCSKAESRSAPFTDPAQLNRPEVRMGIETGSSLEKIALETFPNARFYYCTTLADMAYQVQSGTLDGFVCDLPAAQLMEKSVSGITYLDHRIQNDGYAFAFPKTAEGLRLRDEVNEFLWDIRSDGTLDTIRAAWFEENTADRVTDQSDLTGENGTLTLATSSTFVPFDYVENGKIIGFDLDLATRFCREKGYGLEILDLNFDAVIASIGSRADLGASGLSATEERMEQVYFSDTYYEGGVVAVVSDGSVRRTENLWDSFIGSFERTFLREQRWKMILSGIGVTVLISVCSAVLGTLLGFGICMLRRMKNPVTHGFTTGYIRILQGTPLVVLLMILFYLVFPGTGVSGIWVSVIGFSLNFAAYVSEMMRSGIEAVDVGQTEAALAIGFTPGRAFFRIILPQAARHFLPVYKGELISLVKSTSIVGYIAVQDLTKVSDMIRSRTYEPFFPLIATAVIYFCISALLSSLLNLIGPRHSAGSKKAAGKEASV